MTGLGQGEWRAELGWRLCGLIQVVGLTRWLIIGFGKNLLFLIRI